MCSVVPHKCYYKYNALSPLTNLNERPSFLCLCKSRKKTGATTFIKCEQKSAECCPSQDNKLVFLWCLTAQRNEGWQACLLKWWRCPQIIHSNIWRMCAALELCEDLPMCPSHPRLGYDNEHCSFQPCSYATKPTWRDTEEILIAISLTRHCTSAIAFQCFILICSYKNDRKKWDERSSLKQYQAFDCMVCQTTFSCVCLSMCVFVQNAKNRSALPLMAQLSELTTFMCTPGGGFKKVNWQGLTRLASSLA